MEFEDQCIKEEEHRSTFDKHKKNQLIDLQNLLERRCNVHPVFGCNSATYDINLIMSYLLLLLVNERGIAPIVIQIANQFVSFKLEVLSF